MRRPCWTRLVVSLCVLVLGSLCVSLQARRRLGSGLGRLVLAPSGLGLCWTLLGSRIYYIAYACESKAGEGGGPACIGEG